MIITISIISSTLLTLDTFFTLYMICASKSDPPELAPALKIIAIPNPTIMPPNTQDVNKSRELVFSKLNNSKKTDKKTVLNLTNHAYFNLSGYDSYKSIENHSLWIDSDKITAINKQLIPNGEVIDVTNTPFDFRALKLIGKEINADNEILRIGQGYDHNYILNNNSDYKHVLTLIDNESKRMLKLYTNQPCIQIYTANCINEEEGPFKNGIPQKKRCAICLETQHAPNSPNIPQFKSTELDVGEEYNYTTTFEFENI